MIIIGTDEAGYGPNYGPLIVSATLWDVESLHHLQFFVDTFAETGFSIGDSKKIYHAGHSLTGLETVVLGIMQFLSIKCKTLNELFQALSEQQPVKQEKVQTCVSIPVAAKPEQIDDVSLQFEQAKKDFGVRLKRMQSRIVFPAEFNRLLDRSESKGMILSEVTLQLLLELQRSENLATDSSDSDTDLLILCDKHGGRNRYLDLLHKFYPDEMIWVDHESRESSVYRFETQGRAVEIRFIAKGESETPIALASMVSKYLRELSMLSFNAFWRQHLPDLKPTAGYPEDARRFQRDIIKVQTRLGIDNREIWREK